MSFEPVKKNMPVIRTARYFMSAPVIEGTRHVWIVLHGYAQHARFFLQKFEPLFDAETVFVAPEGLSRFYVKGSSGKVGASWMTSEDRLDEITDYVNYLDQLVKELRLSEGVILTVLGFSQGVATVARWVEKGAVCPHRVILYAGVFPPDLGAGFGSNRWENLPVHVIAGSKDEFYRPGELQHTYGPLQRSNALVKFHEFDGGHEIFAGVLRQFLD